jgi:hypothetical protein
MTPVFLITEVILKDGFPVRVSRPSFFSLPFDFIVWEQGGFL